MAKLSFPINTELLISRNGIPRTRQVGAFDLLELNGEDLRQQTLDERKSKLAKLLKGSRHHGIVLNEYLEADGERAFYVRVRSALRVLSQSDVIADMFPGC